MRGHVGYFCAAVLVLAVARVARGSSCTKAYGKEPNWDDYECRSFYYCDDYYGSLVHCPHGFQFHYEHKECLEDKDVFCKWQIDYYSSSHHSDHSDEHYDHQEDHSSSYSSHECDHEHGKEPDYHAEHCETYYECDHHHGALRRCPSGQQFHWHDLECYNDDEVMCQEQRKSHDHGHHSHDVSHDESGSDDMWLYHMLASLHGSGGNNGQMIGGGNGREDNGVAEALAAAALLRPGGLLGIQGNALPIQGNFLPFGQGVQPFQVNQGLNPIPVNQNPNLFAQGGIGFAGNPVQLNPAINLGPNVNQFQAAGGQGFGLANQGQNAFIGGGNPNVLGLGGNPFGVGRDASTTGVDASSVVADNPDQVIAQIPDLLAFTPQQEGLARDISTLKVPPGVDTINVRALPPAPLLPPGVGNAGQLNPPLPLPATNNLDTNDENNNNNNIAISVNNEQGLALNGQGQVANGQGQAPAAVAAGNPVQGSAVNTNPAVVSQLTPAQVSSNAASAGTRLARPRLSIQGTQQQDNNALSRAQGTQTNVLGTAQGTQPVAQITVSLQGQGTQPLPATQGTQQMMAQVPVSLQGRAGTLPLPGLSGPPSASGQQGAQSGGFNAVPAKGTMAALPQPLPLPQAARAGNTVFIPSIGIDVPVVDQRWSAASSSEATNTKKSAASAAFSQNLKLLPVAAAVVAAAPTSTADNNDSGSQNARALPNVVDAGSVEVPLVPDAPLLPAMATNPRDWVLVTQATTPSK